MILKKIIIALIFLSHTTQATACIWQGGDSAFWSSYRIEVCFIPATGIELTEHRDLYLRAKRIIENGYRLFNQETSLEFFGFNDCHDMTNSQRSEKIRIDLMLTDGLGRAYSVGPASARYEHNMILTYAMQAAKTSDGLPRPILEENLLFLVLHESMHLLGIHHEHPRNSKWWAEMAQDVFFLENFDAGSVMNITPEEMGNLTNNRSILRAAPFLTIDDKRCIDAIVSRDILQMNQ